MYQYDLHNVLCISGPPGPGGYRYPYPGGYPGPGGPPGQVSILLLEYSSFNCGNYLEVHMEKYVIPPFYFSDFKFPSVNKALLKEVKPQAHFC